MLSISSELIFVAVVWDDGAVEKLLDRSQVGDKPDEQDDEKAGMNEYLRSFKVASYQVKETTEQVGHTQFISDNWRDKCRVPVAPGKPWKKDSSFSSHRNIVEF